MSLVKRQSGFTILEVMLFLAISGMLLLIALLGTGSSIAQTRFGDSVRSTESLIEGQYDLIFNGQNSRPTELKCKTDGTVIEDAEGTNPGTSARCVLLGKLINVSDDKSKIDIYTVVGVTPTSDTSDMGEQQLVVAYSPHVAKVAAEHSTTEITWGATVLNAVRTNAAGEKTNINTLVLLRSPLNNSNLSYAFTWHGATDITDSIDQANTYIGSNRTATICLQSADNGRLAAIQIGGGQGAANVSAAFDVKQKDCKS